MLSAGSPVTVGIDIGATVLRGVALRQRGSTHEVLAAVETVRAPNHPVPTLLDVERLIHALQRQGVETRSVVIVAPSDRLANAIMELPPRSSGAPIETLARTELNKNVTGDLEVFVWDLPPGRNARASEYLAIGLAHSVAMELMAPFLQAGLTVEAIEPEVTALERITGANARIILDVGTRSLCIYAYEASRTLFFRHVELSGDALDSDRVRAVMTGTIDYVAARFPALEDGSVFVLGDDQQIERIAATLLREYDTEIQRELQHNLRLPAWLGDTKLDARWTTAIGLATRPQQAEVAA